MRLVEAVAREFDDQVPEVLRLARLQPVGDAALDELLAALGDGLLFLFADRLDAGVG
jgi:hypothetical protein